MNERHEESGLYALLQGIRERTDALAQEFRDFRTEQKFSNAGVEARLGAVEARQGEMQEDIRAIRHDAQQYVSNRALYAGIITGLVTFGLVAYIMFQVLPIPR